MATAFIFPGQGSQAPGMGKGLYDAFGASREVFQEVDEALGEKLSKLIFEGPAEELTLTANAQPALMAVSLAAMRAHPLGRDAAIIGTCTADRTGMVVLDTGLGRRLIAEPEGEPLPRIC